MMTNEQLDNNKAHDSHHATLFQQGKQARRDGHIAAAIACFEEVIRLKDDYIPAYNNLGNLLQAQGQITEAIAVYEKALQLAPHMAVLHCNHASLLQIQGEHDRAIAGYQQALILNPNFFLAHHNLGKVLAFLGQARQAITAYQKALRIQPETGDVYLDLGHVYRQLGRSRAAISSYKAAIRFLPQSALAYNSLGAMLQHCGETKLSQTCYRRALALEPDYAAAHFNLGQLLEALGQLEVAQMHYQRSLELQPLATNVLYHLEHLRLKLADWQDYEQRVATLINRTQEHLEREPAEALPALILMAFPVPDAMRLAVARQLARSHAHNVAALHLDFPEPSIESAPKRLRIGYVSPDFRCHAVGTLIHQMFQYHQRPDFEIFAYSLVPLTDEWTQIIRAGCDHFIEVAFQAPLTIAKRIRADGIHILIDLAGYTTQSLTPLFALQPAPVQIQYLGYPGTMGADFLPYLIADTTIVPPELVSHYSEQLIYLPHAWVATPMAIAPSTRTRKDYGLPTEGAVFCCFNGIYKINPDVFHVWMQILHRVPNSVLWLADGGVPVIAERLQKQAAKAGIDPARLHFAANLPHAEYLARYPLADLFLDTFTYNAGATAVGALWAGLPVLTYPGDSYASRMGAGLCHAVGLPELICNTPLAYQQRAIELGNHPEQLQALTAKLAQARIDSPLFQPRQFIRELEHALQNTWQRVVQQHHRT